MYNHLQLYKVYQIIRSYYLNLERVFCFLENATFIRKIMQSSVGIAKEARQKNKMIYFIPKWDAYQWNDDAAALFTFHNRLTVWMNDCLYVAIKRNLELT